MAHAAENDPLFDYVFLKALHERDHFALFRLRHLEFSQRLRCVSEKHVPVTLTDAHPAMGKLHIPTTVVDRSAGARAKLIDQELQLAFYAVGASMCPEAVELRIFLKSCH